MKVSDFSKKISLLSLICLLNMLVMSIFTNINLSNYTQITLTLKKVQAENQDKSGKRCPSDQVFNPTRKECEETSGPCIAKNEVRNEKGICLIPDKAEDCSRKEVIGESAKCEPCPKGMAPLNGECKTLAQSKINAGNDLPIRKNNTNNNQISIKGAPKKDIKKPLLSRQYNSPFNVIVRVNPVVFQDDIKYNAIVFLRLDAVQAQALQYIKNGTHSFHQGIFNFTKDTIIPGAKFVTCIVSFNGNNTISGNWL